MARAIWKGSINFGLVNIPVALHSGEEREELGFKLLDRRHLAPVRYKRVNERTGREVPWDEIVKGYEYKNGEHVVLTEEDFRRADVEATQTVEITSFVDASEIDPVYYDKPYYLEPLKKAHKSYALLREVLERTGKVGIGKIVIRSRQYLAGVLVWGPVLVVNLLRYADELRDPKTLKLPPQSFKTLDIARKEIKLAERLVETMIESWKPAKYHDAYREKLLALIETKAKRGATEAIEELPKEISQKRTAQVVDIMDLLKRSVEKAKAEGPPSRKRTEGRRKAS
jgi:DNA end-binding protein Ku